MRMESGNLQNIARTTASSGHLHYIACFHCTCNNPLTHSPYVFVDTGFDDDGDTFKDEFDGGPDGCTFCVCTMFIVYSTYLRFLRSTITT